MRAGRGRVGVLERSETEKGEEIFGVGKLGPETVLVILGLYVFRLLDDSKDGLSQERGSTY